MTDAENAMLAESLINTRTLPPGLERVRLMARQARDYHKLAPYPEWHFRDWNQDDRGPLPRCLPLPKRIVKRGARWLFGKPITITCAANTTLETALRLAWTENRMPSRLRAMAENAALDGGIVLKFSVDETSAAKQIAFQSLSLVDQVRLFFHPHDRDLLLMARVQYSYYDAQQGKTMWYREEWTAQREVHYHPVADTDITGAKADPDTFEGWKIDETKSQENPFQLIPLHLCKNIETDDVWGAGDLWSLCEEDGLYRVIDRINLTYHLMDRSNQFDSQLNPIFFDAEEDPDDADKPLDPGQPQYLTSTTDANGTARQGNVVFPPTGNNLRPQMMEYARDLRDQFLDAASSVVVDQGAITNKGNMTTAVLKVIYAAQIEITLEKRKSMGSDGIGRFLSLCACGCQNAGVDLGVSSSATSYDVQIGYAEFFEPGEDEMKQQVDRTSAEEQAGYLSHDRAIERNAKMNGIEDTEKLKKEIAAQPPPEPADDPEPKPTSQ